MAVNPVLPLPIRQSPSWQVWASYALPLLVFSGAPWWGLDAEVLALAGIAIALTHWFLPPLSATLLLLGSGQLISLANAEKLRDTGDAILWQDISYALPNLFANLGTLWQYVGLGNLLAGAIALLLLLAALMVERRHLRRSLRIGAGFSTALMLFYLPTTIDYSLAVAADMRQFRESAKGFAGRLNTLSLARFLHSVTLPPADFQAAGDPELFREQAAKLAVTEAGNRKLLPPDIFVLLNESQFNPSQLAACANRNDCGMPLYEAHQQSAARGPLRVHTHGWGTWNAEFTLMTGMPYFWFGETGFYSAYTTAPRMRMALARHLSALGYRTIGIYPTQKGMLNAARAYRNYGIQEFYGAEDLDLPLDWCKIPDQLMYEKLRTRYRAAREEDNRPIFMVMLTVFNHGPHGAGCMDPDLARSIGKDASPQRAKLEDYLHRSRANSLASITFRDIALALPRPVLLLFAGDHQPSFEGLAASYPRQMHRTMPAGEALLFTNYQFLTNYDATPAVAPGKQPREMDISFLASTLLELAMLPMGPLFEPNLKLRDLCDGRLDSCAPALIESYKANLNQTGFYK
jgi:hypothetical protein